MNKENRIVARVRMKIGMMQAAIPVNNLAVITFHKGTGKARSRFIVDLECSPAEIVIAKNNGTITM